MNERKGGWEDGWSDGKIDESMGRWLGCQKKKIRSFVSNKHSALLKKRGKEGVTLYLNLGSHLSEEVAWLE